MATERLKTRSRAFASASPTLPRHIVRGDEIERNRLIAHRQLIVGLVEWSLGVENIEKIDAPFGTKNIGHTQRAPVFGHLIRGCMMRAVSSASTALIYEMSFRLIADCSG